MSQNTNKLILLTFCTGSLGALLRAALYLTGTDSKGLLISGHWAHLAVWVLTGLAVLLIVLSCRKIRQPDGAAAPVPSPIAAAGCLAAAAGFLLISLPEWRSAMMPLEKAAALAGFASAAGLVYIAACRFLGRTPHPLSHGLICITFALRMVCQYRLWSSDPQLQDYCFYMGSHVALMLTAYHFAALDAGLGTLRRLWLLGLAAAYLSLLCLWGAGNALFLLCCAIWVLTNLPTPLSRRVRPAMPREETEP